MIHDLIVFGGVAFWLITIIVFLITLSLVESVEDFSYASGIQVLYLTFLVLFCNITLDLSKYWWCPIPYLLIGLVWFIFMMTHKIKLLRKWIDKQENPEKIRSELDNKYSGLIPYRWQYIYNTEPSWPKFFDRILFWPLSMLKFACQDLLQTFYNMCVDQLIVYKNSLLGIKKG